MSTPTPEGGTPTPQVEQAPVSASRPPAPWFCEAHQLWTTTDCPRCDDEMIADLERRYPSCASCGRSLTEDESAWAAEVKVIEPGGIRVVTRYTCDDCEAAA